MLPILIIILAGVLILLIWNLFTLRQLKKDTYSLSSNLNDSKYWELKFKQEFIIAIVGIILTVAAYLGYNTKNSVETELKREITFRIDSVENNFKKQIDSDKLIVDTIRKTAKTLDSSYRTFTQTQNVLDNKALNTEASFKDLKDKVDEINKKNILKEPIYIAKYLYKYGDTEIVRYDNLTTISGDKMPTFSKAPLVLAVGPIGLLTRPKVNHVVISDAPQSTVRMPWTVNGRLSIYLIIFVNP